MLKIVIEIVLGCNTIAKQLFLLAQCVYQDIRKDINFFMQPVLISVDEFRLATHYHVAYARNDIGSFLFSDLSGVKMLATQKPPKHRLNLHNFLIVIQATLWHVVY